MDDILTTADLFEAAGRFGYLHPGYAESHIEAGEVRHLRRSGAWLLNRPIPGSDRFDARVGQPLLVCRDWGALPDDLAETAALADVVTVSALSDPLAPVTEAALRDAFTDVVRVHAQHFIVDLPSFWPSRDHRRAARRALRLVEIDIEEAPGRGLSQWPGLTARPGGVMPAIEAPGLSRAALTRQLGVPGCVSITALDEDGPVAMAIVFLAGEDAHLHLVVGNARGDALAASYALYAATAEDMAGRGLHRLDLGTAAAADPESAEDAVRFLAGWTDQIRPSYRCGRIVDRVAYDELTAEAGATGSPAFPAYRQGGSE